MSEEKSSALLQRTWLGHLACCHNGQPYVVPIGFVFHQRALYCCGSEGRKIEWMRTNPRVCVEVEEIKSRQEWQTVVIFGRYEEMPDRPEFLDERIDAYERLAQIPFWWQPAFSPTRLDDQDRPMRPLFFRIAIDELNGHEGDLNTRS